MMPAKKTTILAADDDPQLLRLMTRNLQLEGFDVLAASDGQQAVERLLAAPGDYDAVLMDVQMPVMNGYDATAAIRRSGAPLEHLPVIAMTANVMEDDRRHAALLRRLDMRGVILVRQMHRCVLAAGDAPQQQAAYGVRPAQLRPLQCGPGDPEARPPHLVHG